MAVKYSFPPGLAISPECADLLARIFVASPQQRITIPQIRAHPWFRINLPAELAVSGCCWSHPCSGTRLMLVTPFSSLHIGVETLHASHLKMVLHGGDLASMCSQGIQAIETDTLRVQLLVLLLSSYWYHLVTLTLGCIYCLFYRTQTTTPATLSPTSQSRRSASWLH
jgi:hypothetical protein